MNDNMSALIETKLTKSEAIDLLIQEMRNELEAKLAANERKIKEIESSFTTADFAGGVGTFTVSDRYGSGPVSFSFRLARSQLNTSGVVKLNAIDVLSAEREVLRKQEYAMDAKGGKAKNTILKAMLEGSEEGKQFLRLIDGLKLKVSPKLLGTGQ